MLHYQFQVMFNIFNQFYFTNISPLLLGVLLILMVLFSGFIQPKSVISDGWIWFYWMNPIAWALKSVTVNEFKAPKYDFLTCTNQACTETMRFGDFVLVINSLFV